MKKYVGWGLLALWLAGVLAGNGWADPNNAYTNGVEGIKCASAPPPGQYYKMYNAFYSTEALQDERGHEIKALAVEVNILANVHRFLWVTDAYQLWGADLAADIFIPLVRKEVEVGPYDETECNLGDIVLEPFVLAWHGGRYDSVAAVAFVLPTGEHDELADPGQGMYTTMFTLGGTYYLDAARTWSASILGRYEIHEEDDDTDLTPGDDFHLEWGLGKTLAKFYEVGLTGYYQKQVTSDSGPDKAKDEVYAVGPEVSVFWPPAKLFLSLKYQREMSARDRFQGHITVFSLTRVF